MSDSQTPRQYLVAQLQPLLPRKWRFVPFETSLDVLSQPVVMLKLQTVRKTPEAPGAGFTAEYVLTVIEPKTDPGPAEIAIDDKVLDLIYAIEKVPGLVWKDATRVMFSDTNQAYDISIEVLTTRPILKE